MNKVLSFFIVTLLYYIKILKIWSFHNRQYLQSYSTF